MSRSKEEAIAAGVKIAETQHNMKRRKPWHNYCRKGTYMLTLVVEGRHAVLGKVVAMPAGDAAGVVEDMAATLLLYRELQREQQREQARRRVALESWLS